MTALEGEHLVRHLWADIDGQNWDALAAHFAPDAVICWHNTNERFTVGEFIRANREYPGDWRIDIERLVRAGDTVVSVARVRLADGSTSFHATSFFEIAGGAIRRLDEYWGDDGAPPKWRVDQRIGRPINE